MDPKHGNKDVLTLLITVQIKPECEQEFLSFMETYAATATSNEPGLLLYTLLSVPDRPHTYMMLQRYADHAAHEHHRTMPYRTEGLERLKGWATAIELRMLPQVVPR